VDPLAPDYPHNSPYAFSENVVIHAIELEGLEKQVLFKAIVDDVSSTSDQMWNDSFGHGKKGDKTREVGGTIIKTVNDGEITYQVINLVVSKSSDAVRIDYSGTNEENLIGSIHTHPYSEKDISRYQKWIPSFEGTGVPFSGGDLMAYNRPSGTKLKSGQIHLLETGSTVFGLGINDAEKARKFFSNNQVLEDFELFPEGLDEGYEQEAWDQMKSVVVQYEEENGAGSSGINIYRIQKGESTVESAIQISAE
jgi:hypothetical protein